MNHVVLNKQPRKLHKYLTTLLAGAVASLVTQPFEVLKTNMIVSSQSYFKEIHRNIIRRGWAQYMRGGSIAVTRQAFGFSIYTSLIHNFNNKIENGAPNLNKYLKYSLSAISAKYIAMVFESPLTLMKTRLEANPSSSIPKELKTILENPFKQVKKGLGSTFAREGFFSLFHYNTYRLLKDEVLMNRFSIDSNFFPAFFAGIVAITVSQPFQVIRSKLTLQKENISFMDTFRGILRTCGWRGLFVGFVPRLLRKPINSGICWTIMENARKLE